MKETVRIGDNIFKIGPLGNPKVLCSYLVIDSQISIVDCGPSVVIDELLAAVASIGISRNDISQLLLTHIHIDHAGGSSKFLEQCPNSKAYVPKRGYKFLVDPARLNASAESVLGKDIFNYWGECSPVKKEKLIPVEPNQMLDLGSREIQYIEATGHAPHHNVLLEEKSKILFAADALGIFDDQVTDFASPTTPPPSFDYAKAIDDITKIRDVIKPSLVCLAHFRTIAPDLMFYTKVLGMYTTWKKEIESYLGTKSSQSTFDARDSDLVYSKLSQIYPSFEKVGPFLRDQIKRVDIAGFAEYLRKSNATSS
ncbi:MAG: MBL fold metallo-hydrolase [Nitrososphaerales archaeon]